MVPTNPIKEKATPLIFTLYPKLRREKKVLLLFSKSVFFTSSPLKPRLNFSLSVSLLLSSLSFFTLVSFSVL